MGLDRLEQIAALRDEDLERVARELKIPVGRVRRYDWAGDAAALVAARSASGGSDR
jgi:predicted flap endonuclease-1-like 5' DNA nuclease